MLVPTIVCLFIATAKGINATTFNASSPTFASNTSASALLTNAFTSNATVFVPLGPPLYQNVTAGDAWVFPSSANDLDARTMSCECFNPDDQCCMPTSPNIGPFCMPTGSTCCGDTFCVAGQSCCGEFCCAAKSVCNVKTIGSGCCPFGAICQGSAPPTCYDHASSNCSNKASPPHQCCPSTVPFCRDFKPYGVGCYASSTTASSASSVPAMTAAGTSDIFAPSVGESTTKGATHTVTISVVSNGHGGVSLDFPTKIASLLSEGGQTTYVLDWPANSATAVPAGTSTKSAEETKTAGSSTGTAATTSTPASISQSELPSPSTTPARSSSISPLCYDPNANTHSPCPTTTTTPSASSSSSTSTAGFNPPGATIVKSQASTKPSLPSLGPLRDLFNRLHAFSQTDHGKQLLVYISLIFHACFFAYFALRFLQKQSHAPGDRKEPRHDNIAKGGLSERDEDGSERAGNVLAGSLGEEVGGGAGRFVKGRTLLLEEDDGDDAGDGAERHVVLPAGSQMVVDNDDDGVTDLAHEEVVTARAETEAEKPDITVVEGSARPLLEPRVVSKREIRVVEGSGRPFVKGRRTHSLWEGMDGMGTEGGEGDVGGGEEDGEGGGVGEEGGLGHVFVWARG